MDMESLKRLIPSGMRQALAQARRRLRPAGPRRYIPEGVTVETFFREVAGRSARCVVLRWFDTLPRISPGEDIDMLVADEDLPAIASLLSKVRGSTPCDVYTVGGLPGTRYRDMPYFPADLARRTIERRVLQDGLYQIPSPEDHFFGLAYHAVYQKGPAAGLPTRLAGVSVETDPEHDYRGVLTRLAGELGFATPIDLDSLDLLLAEHGYRPSPRELRILAPTNDWLSRQLMLADRHER